MKRFLLTAWCALAFALALPAADTLEMWLVDTEGGLALLMRNPSGQAMLIDTGFPGSNDRDATRILEACKAAGVTKLDILLTTHYDLDHVNNLPTLVAKIPVDLYIDHGPAAVDDRGTAMAVAAYDAIWAKAKHLVVKPGDKIPFKDVDITVVTSAKKDIAKPLPGAGKPNPSCKGMERKVWTRPPDEDVSENANTIGMVFNFGKLRMVNLSDLTWNRELELMCPNDPIGPADLFWVSHHGNDISNSAALVNAIQPRVSLMSNGARKIGAASAIKTVKASPRFQALYMTHWSANAPNDNPADEFLANLRDARGETDGKWLQVSADKNANITVTNGRTGEKKTYKP